MKHIDIEKLDRIYPNAYIQEYLGISEPGYDDQPVLLGNWNHVPNHVQSKIESLGYALEWCDEWTSCDSCYKIFRTSPNGYDWQQSGVIDDCDCTCLKCLNPAEYYASLENTTDHAVTNVIAHKYPLKDYGYFLIEGDYKSGFYGVNDNPKNILSVLLIKNKHARYIFALDYSSQFEMGFSVYRKRESREWRVYCVREGLSGCYMPDNVSYFTSKRATLDYMREVKNTLLDSEYVVEGSAESGYDYKWEDQDYFPYGVDWSIMVFSSKKERDEFINQNQDC